MNKKPRCRELRCVKSNALFTHHFTQMLNWYRAKEKKMK